MTAAASAEPRIGLTTVRPDRETLDHRYFREDMGLGLVLYGKLGGVLGVPTPTAGAFVAIGSVISDVDYATVNRDILAQLGIEGLDAEALRRYLETGVRS